jgi:hypothetical protein
MNILTMPYDVKPVKSSDNSDSIKWVIFNTII